MFLSTELHPPPPVPRSATYTARTTPIKRSSSAQAPTRTKQRAPSPSSPPSEAIQLTRALPTSPARPPRRPHSELLHIVLEEGDPDRDSLPRTGPYASLVPPFSPWNTTSKEMIGLHTPTGSIISPTLISPERYAWLHAAHSRRRTSANFTQDLLQLLARYHPRAKSLNPQGRHLKLTNQWAIPPTLRNAMEKTFLTTTELFGSPLNCPMTDGLTYCSAFQDDIHFGAILDSFRYRWTASCMANPEYGILRTHRCPISSSHDSPRVGRLPVDITCHSRT